MPKHPLSFVEFHNQFFMQGVNMGNKVNAAQRKVKLLLDDERQVVWVYFNKKIAFVPLASIASADVIQVPEDILELLETAEPKLPPAMARARQAQLDQVGSFVDSPGVPDVSYDPNDPDEAALHRAQVRAASANANKPNPAFSQNDHLIQESRSTAMGFKTHTTTAQVSHPAKPQGASVQGKPKALTRAQAQTIVAQEMKETPV